MGLYDDLHELNQQSLSSKQPSPLSEQGRKPPLKHTERRKKSNRQDSSLPLRQYKKAPAQNPTAVVPQYRTTAVQQSSSAELPKSGSPAVQHSGTTGLDTLDDYPLLDFREYVKVDLRLTWDQKRYLDELEELIARKAPGVEKGNPLSKRITRSSVLRALVEIMRRLEVTFDPSQFQNERDVITSLAKLLRESLNQERDRKKQ